MGRVPSSRIEACNASPVRADGEFILYWMIAFRRTRWNFSLQRALEWARELKKPLVIMEALRAGYPWASDRLHRFILDGMADNARRLQRSPILYYSYVEARPGAGRGLLTTLAGHACVVVTDDYPAFFLPRMVAGIRDRLRVPPLPAEDLAGPAWRTPVSEPNARRPAAALGGAAGASQPPLA